MEPDVREALTVCQKTLAFILDPKNRGCGIEDMVLWASLVAAEKKVSAVVETLNRRAA